MSVAFLRHTADRRIGRRTSDVVREWTSIGWVGWQLIKLINEPLACFPIETIT